MLMCDTIEPVNHSGIGNANHRHYQSILEVVIWRLQLAVTKLLRNIFCSAPLSKIRWLLILWICQLKKNSRDGLDEMQCSLYVIYYVQVWANWWDSKSLAPNINLFQCLCINKCSFTAEASLPSCLFSLGKEDTWTGFGWSRFSPSHSDKAQQIAPMTGISQFKNGFWDKRLGWDQLGCTTALRHGQFY